MALPLLAPVESMEVRLGIETGTLADADLARAEAALGDVSALVRLEAGTDFTEEDGVTLGDVPDAVAIVVLQAALRAYRNPDGFQGESVGDYSYQYVQGASGAYLTDDEVSIVKRSAAIAAGGSTGFTGTIRTPSAYSDESAPADFVDYWT